MLQTASRAKTLRICCASLTVIAMLCVIRTPIARAQGNTALGTNALLHNTTGTDNSAFGFSTLYSNTTGYENTAVGSQALFANVGDPTSFVDGDFNTATGYEALFNNTQGYYNTGVGERALYSNTTGNDNTACGSGALLNNSTGALNTAAGSSALANNTVGNDNTATGVSALAENTTGTANVASGEVALSSNTIGSNNTAIGTSALIFSISGGNNTAVGADAMQLNATGSNNTAIGDSALANNEQGSNNIAIGQGAGSSPLAGNNNINIGNRGFPSDENTIHIGTAGVQNAIYLAGIGALLTSGTPVAVSSNGRLGVLSSSARYKRDIHDMGDTSDKLMKLRPVSFRYKADPSGSEQYGLIAEEVAKVDPNLVVSGPDGKPETVAYHLLPAMLLNELQKQARADRRRDQELAEKDGQITELKRQLANLATRLDALEQQAHASRPERFAAASR